MRPPKGTSLGGNTSYNVSIVKIGPRVRARREPKNKVLKKGIPKKPQHVFFHVFAQTTHVVAEPHGFACVGIPATRLYIPSFIEIRSGVSDPQGGQNLAFPITLASRFYNSLYYRTSRDYRIRLTCSLMECRSKYTIRTCRKPMLSAVCNSSRILMIRRNRRCTKVT